MGGIIGGVGALAGGLFGMFSAGEAADAQVEASHEANELQRWMYERNRRDFAPWRYAGYNALSFISTLLGMPQPQGLPGQARLGPAPKLEDYRLGGGGNALSGYSLQQIGDAGQYVLVPDQATGQDPIRGNAPNALGGTGTGYDYDAYNRDVAAWDALKKRSEAGGGSATNILDLVRKTPGYQFRLGEGINALDKSAAARGMVLSGAQDKAVQRYGEGLASDEYQNYLNRLFGVAGLGQTSTAQTAQLGANAANQMGQNALYAGNARASGYINQANALSGGMNSAMTNYLLWNLQRKQ